MRALSFAPGRFRFRIPSVLYGIMRLACAAAALFAVAATPARAQDGVFRRSIQIRVGETQQLGIWGGHRSDCITSVPPLSVRVVQAPQLGTLSERTNVPYAAQNSLSGTCQGARFFGTAVDYKARVPGADTVALDPTFGNGASHWVYSITVVP